LNSVLQCYQNEKTTFHAFDAGFFIGLSALFYWPSAILILLLFVSLFSFKPFYWNEYVAAVIGLLIPVLFLSSKLLILILLLRLVIGLMVLSVVESTT
jgi:hypothetical protein